jgi:5-methylcytosine-specific restriction endonuclease McrA
MPDLAASAVFHCDHFRPLADGGETTESNLVWACPNCNLDKSKTSVAKDPRTRRLTAIFNPRTDRWDRHFEWSKDRLRIRGTTPTGRATVRLLDMNRPSAKHLRFLFLLAGEHPAGK